MIWKSLLFAFLAVGTTHLPSVLAGYNVTDEMLREIKDEVKHRCEITGHEDKVDDAVNAVVMSLDCVETLPDPGKVITEFMDARSNNTLSDFFKKYCAITPQLKVCLNPIFRVTPCMEPNVRHAYDYLVNETDVLIDFMCYKDGARPILFFAEGGIECISKHNKQILDCSFGTIDPNMPKCTAITERLACVVNAMEDCSSHVPSELTNSLFKLMWKPELCNERDWMTPN